MENLFFTVLGMSLTGSFVILFVLLARLALRKAPKVFSYALWAVALFRLLCPFALDSAFSLLPSARMVDTAGRGGGTDQVIQVQTGILALNSRVNGFLADHPYQEEQPVVVGGSPEEGLAPVINQLGPVPDWRTLPAAIWLAGTAALLGYSVLSLLRLRRRLTGSVPLVGEKNVRLADHIPSPFVLGLVRPVVYLPSGLAEGERDYILLHERTHIRRCDHVTRALAWLAVAVHWFNPLVWLAFHLAGRDMEMSCDEAVLEGMGRDIRADYSTSLLRLSVGGKLPAGPLAFGGGDPQNRIKNILSYKKPAFWVAALALMGVLCLGVGLATDRAPGLFIDPDTLVSYTAVNSSSCTSNPDHTIVSTDADRQEDLADPTRQRPLSKERGDAQIQPVAGGTPDDTGIDLTFTMAQVNSGPFLRVAGKVYSRELRWAVWSPEGADALYGPHPGGELTMEYDFESGGVNLAAWWADEERTQVAVTTKMSVLFSSYMPSGWWEFTVDLSGEQGRVVSMEAKGGEGTLPDPVKRFPETITDQEAVLLARVAAKTMTAAEDFYHNYGEPIPSPPTEHVQYTPTYFPGSGNGSGSVRIDGLGEGETLELTDEEMVYAAQS